MLFTLDPNARSPLYRQIHDQVMYAVSIGELSPGDSLPSIREIEARHAINRNTVLRAYRELQHDGVVLLRQGREARIVRRATIAGHHRLTSSPSLALVKESIARAEIDGCDSIRFAKAVLSFARNLDQSLPRCAFVECSQRQAEQLAQRASHILDRHVIGLSLSDLRSQSFEVPPSVKFVFVSRWHLTEVRELCADQRLVCGVGLRIGRECETNLKQIPGNVAVVVRDSESIPGYCALVKSCINDRSVLSATLDDTPALSEALNKTHNIVCTPPCANHVRKIMRQEHNLIELVFEPDPGDLASTGRKCFGSHSHDERPNSFSNHDAII